MKIIIKEKTYTLRMTSWDGSDWIEENAEDLVIDSGYHWDEDAEAWRMDGGLEGLDAYLKDWEDYRTDYDRDLVEYHTEDGQDEEDARESLKEDYPRRYELEEVAES